MADAGAVLDGVRAVASTFAGDRRARQARRSLDPADFAALADAGFLATGLPAERGGLWTDLPGATRPVCEILRTLASADSSVALVASMHPAVLSFWLSVDEPALASQRDDVFTTVEQGAWWGTITSEPGSGGDVMRTRSVARGNGDGGYLLEGQKHFGSGSGISSYMFTTAIAEGEEVPDAFYLPMAGVPWDGSHGVTLVAEWDGHGMAATQSHAMRFAGFPAVRYAWPGHLEEVLAGAAPYVASLFSAVVVGIVQVGVDTARGQIADRLDDLRSYEAVEWARAEMDAWVIDQIYEGMLRAVETGQPARGAALRGKTAIAELAEQCLLRICRVMGGGTFARHSPFGNWFEDVRALGFLRPPWGLAFDALVAESLTPAAGTVR